MYFNFGYQSTFLLFFFVQGMVFAGLLFRKALQHNRSSSKWLSLFVLLCCLYIVPWTTGHAGWYAQDGYREFLFFVPFQQLFLIGPVIFFYTQSLLEPTFHPKRKDWLHFLPAALYLLYSLVIFVVDQLILEEYYFYADGRDKDLSPWYQISGLISMIVYTGLSIRHYNRYRQRIFEELSFADSVVFGWLRKFLIVFGLILLLRIGFLVFLPDWGSFGIKFWYYLAFGGLYYYIALAGYGHTIELSSSLALLQTDPVSHVSLAQEREEQALDISSPSESSLTEAFLTEWKEKVRSLIEDQQWYKNPTLTLSEVAKELDTTSKQISGIINQGFEMNFNDFVNHYRVEAVKERLAKGDQKQFTLLSIALDCGFNSKSTFNRVFKRNTSMTPLQYLNQLQQAGAKK